jgi:hypothetical protein
LSLLFGNQPSCSQAFRFVCAVTKKGNHTVNFRSHLPTDLSVDRNIHCTIVEAARATSAAPFYFPVTEILGTSYWDGGLQNNNPICQVLAENGPGIPAVVVSLGTGKRQEDEDFEKEVASNKKGKEVATHADWDPLNAETMPPEYSKRPWFRPGFSFPAGAQLRELKECLTNCENQHRNYERVLEHHQVIYRRFNPIIKEQVGLHDYTKLGVLQNATESYLADSEVKDQLKYVAMLLLRKAEVHPVDPLALAGETLPADKSPKHLESHWEQTSGKSTDERLQKPPILDHTHGLSQHQLDHKRRALMDLLTPIDYAPQQNDFMQKRQVGTGQWLLKTAVYNEWLRQPQHTLLCTGMPGAGKTIIASIAINHLQTTHRDNPTVGIAYLYLNFRRQYEQNPTDLLLNLLKQLVQAQPTVPKAVLNLYAQRHANRTRPLNYEIAQVLQSVVAEYSRTFIIVDGLDECRVSDGSRSEFLSEMFNIQVKTKANLLVTSRLAEDILQVFLQRGCLRLEIRASNDDVENYLEGQMSSFPSFVQQNPNLQKDIKARIMSSANGM